jgi:NAD(P)-dependent dehydrogenase (short-subunit alcohol dehydrogenase family)
VPASDRAELAGRVVVVTGAGSGLGEGAARTLAERGASVVCADRDAAAGEVVAGTIQAAGGSAVAVEVDVADWASVEQLAQATHDAFGSAVHGLVQCAGVSEYGRAGDLPIELWHRVIDVNLTGTWYVLRALLPALVAGAPSSVVHVSSIAGLVGTPLSTAYAASKAGVLGLTRQVAVDYGADGVRCNAICPGTIDTPMVRRGYELRGGSAEQSARRFALGRLGEVRDATELIAFLVSERSAWITGATIPLDGGLTATGWLPGA